MKRFGGRCPFYKARTAAEAAHLLVVNHALLLADAQTENRVLPSYNYVIIDEAHHLEAATTDAMSFRLRAPDVTRCQGDRKLESGHLRANDQRGAACSAAL